MIDANTVRLKILDEVSVVIIGLKPNEYTALSEAFALKAPNFQFHPKYKAKQWDGNIRYFTKNGKTYINLLPEIIPLLKELGYKIDVIDKRDQVKIKIPQIDENYLEGHFWPNGNPVVLGAHQVNSVNTLTKHNRGMLRAGTGAGKTLICYVLHHLYKETCGFDSLIIVPTVDLVYQTVLEFNTFSHDVGFWGDSKKNTDHPVVISTWQTLQNQPEFVSRYKHIIVDECHGGKNFSSNLNKIMNEYANNCYVKMGMTGTFPKHPTEYRTLEVALGKMVYEIPAKALIDEGWLAEMKLNMLQLNEPFREEYREYKESVQNKIVEGELDMNVTLPTYGEFKKMLFPEYANERDYLAASYKRNKFIAKLVQGKMTQSERNNSVILVNTRKQGKMLEEIIPNSKFIYGKNNSKTRKAMFDLFSEDNDVIMITTFSLAAVGLNIKRIFNLFMVDAGKSFERVIQTIGRGLRKADDKKVVDVFDIHSDLEYSQRHSKSRKKYYREEGHAITKELKIDYRKEK
jgi:superfamily II DNA or RNA helicase